MNASTTAPQSDLFGTAQSPVLVSWGVGIDSTAMIIAMLEAGERIDHVLFADTRSEKPETYAYLAMFTAWLAERGVPVTVVSHQTKKFKNYPSYSGLMDASLVNGTLPSLAFGGKSCSVRWKIQPQNEWTNDWEPARRVWAAGGLVTKCIGYSTSLADQKRYAEVEGHENKKYRYRYPLREFGMTREACEQRILAAGLPLPKKSACVMCPSCRPHEVDELGAPELRSIVLLEARAKPRLTKIDGLWRKPVKGMRGATPKPGSMTEYIEARGLLSAEDLAAIREAVPTELVEWQDDWTGDEGEMPGRAVWDGVLKLRDQGFFGDPGRMFRGIPVRVTSA